MSKSKKKVDYFVVGEYEHNWKLLLKKIEKKEYFDWWVSSENIARGCPGSAQSCAISQSGYDHMGADCCAYTEESDGKLFTRITNTVLRKRITLWAAGGTFDPHLYDQIGDQCRPGSIVFWGGNVRIQDQQYKAAKNRGYRERRKLRTVQEGDKAPRQKTNKPYRDLSRIKQYLVTQERAVA